MTTTVPARLRRAAPASAPRPLRTDASRIPRLVLATWAALFVNVLSPAGNPTVVPIPKPLLQAVAQGSLILALLLALLVNRRLVIRPNALLVLFSVLAIASLAVSLHNQFLVGSTYRAVRLLVFVAVLWLLSPLWGRRDLVLLRAHRVCLWVVLATVVLGAAISPGTAFAFEGRLAGAVWPIPPTQVAHYAAVLFGTSVVLWMCRVISGRHALVAVVLTLGLLAATHTRTAMLGSLIGLAVATASLFLGHVRVRRVSVSTVAGGIVLAALFAPEIVTWLARGQSVDEAAQLTGRTKVWTDIFAVPRSPQEVLFGSGLSNKSFNGLAIDSNWVASYLDQGWFGIVLQAAMLLLLLAMAVTHVRGPRRAVALFLVVYCLVASITETGLGDASPYLLELVVAASLLVPPAARTGP
ncbi:MAG TPA: hypothetical protein VF140_08375 [Phycicoccus sp.]|nr:hypothetical protein [Phycicoccus sp.]